MSDNELYQVAGLRLANGADPFSIAPEVPPIGKYLYGFSFKLFGNPYYSSILLFLLCSLMFFKLGQLVFSSNTALISSLMLLLSPLFSSQLARTMLDLPQLLFLLTHLYFLFLKNKSVANLLYAGLFLGLFASAKVAVFLPLIFLVDLIYLIKTKQINKILMIYLTAFTTYLLTYTAFFIKDFNLLQWLKNQWWMLKFYLSSNTRANLLNYLSTILIGKLNGWWNQGWQAVDIWSIAWPISIFFTYQYWRQHKITLLTHNKFILSLLIVGFFFEFMLMPFWPRYFLLVLPFGLLFTAEILQKKKIWLSLLIFLMFIQFLAFNTSPPQSTFNFAKKNFDQGNYQDFYSFLSITDLSRNEFYRTLKTIDRDLEISDREIVLKSNFNNRLSSTFNTELQIKYHTPLGTFVNSCYVPIINHHHQWLIKWSWDCIANDFNPNDSKLIYKANQAKSGILYSQDGVILSQNDDYPYLIIDKTKFQATNNNFHLISDLTDQRTTALENLLYVTHEGFDLVKIGFLIHNFDLRLFNELLSMPGIIINHQPARVYNSQLNNKQLLSVMINESKSSSLFGQNGGEIIMQKTNQPNQTLLSKETIHGTNQTTMLNFIKGEL